MNAPTITEALADALERARVTLGLHLDETLKAINERFGLADDRALVKPAKIVTGRIPDAKETMRYSTPVVYLWTNNTTSQEIDVTFREDYRAQLRVAATFSANPARPMSDAQQRAQLYATAITQTLREHIRYACPELEGSGVFQTKNLNVSQPELARFNDNYLARCNASLDLYIRSGDVQKASLLPKMKLPAGPLPSEAMPLVVLETIDASFESLEVALNVNAKTQSLFGGDLEIPQGTEGHLVYVEGQTITPIDALSGPETLLIDDPGTYQLILASGDSQASYTLVVAEPDPF